MTIPFFYRLFFLYIEPISALLGAYWAGARPSEYLGFLASSKLATGAGISSPNTPTLISLYQLSNLYLLFALNEHLVLSSTTSLKTWRALLFCLLVADLGHLATMAPLGFEKGLAEVYLTFWRWNAMEWGSVGFVYAGATMRTCFLLGVGLSADTSREKREQ